MNVKKRTVVITTLLCLMCLCLFVGCKTKNVYFSVPELSYENAIYAEKGKDYRLEVPENPGYFFVGYYDENGKQYTNAGGQSLNPFDGNKLELHGRYTPRHYQLIIKKESEIKYSGVDSYASSFSLQNGYYRSDSSWYAIGLTLPELPTVTQEHKIFKGWYAVKGEEKIQIADEKGYLKGMDKLNAEAFDLAANPTVEHATLELFPLFEPIMVNVTFTYSENGREITETLQVPEGEYLDEVAPKYVDGETERMRCWYTKGYDYLKDGQSFQKNYKKTTTDGLEVYAPEGFFIRKHANRFYEEKYEAFKKNPENSSVRYETSPYIYEYYAVDQDGIEISCFYLKMDNIQLDYRETVKDGVVTSVSYRGWSQKIFSTISISPSVKEVTFLGGSQYCDEICEEYGTFLILEGIQVSERTTDLSVKFRTTGNHIHSLGTSPLIDASAMKDGSVLTLDFAVNEQYKQHDEYGYYYVCVQQEDSDTHRYLFNGADGDDWSKHVETDGDGYKGGDAESGTDIKPLIVANNLVLRSDNEKTVYLRGGNGGNGGTGGGGENSNGPKNSTAGKGGSGGNGGNGGCALRVGGNLKLEGTASWAIIGGNGGNAGDGGRGGDGYGMLSVPDYGGDGGTGGRGGNGARAIEFGGDANTVIGVTKMQGTLTITNGNGGNGGAGGNGGNTEKGIGASVLGGVGGYGGDGGDCYKPVYFFDSEEVTITINTPAPGLGKKRGNPGKDPHNDTENYSWITDGRNGFMEN